MTTFTLQEALTHRTHMREIGDVVVFLRWNKVGDSLGGCA